MDAAKEIKRYERRIANDKKKICELMEENEALRQLLDCAAANISLLVKEQGGVRTLSQNDVKEALGVILLYLYI